MILPEIGGRIQRLYDKTNGYDAVYYNNELVARVFKKYKFYDFSQT